MANSAQGIWRPEFAYPARPSLPRFRPKDFQQEFANKLYIITLVTQVHSQLGLDPKGPPEPITTLVDRAEKMFDTFPRLWAIEGTSAYGAGLTTLLLALGQTVVEVDRPARPPRRGGIKTDQVDAVRAAIVAEHRQAK